jgi:hypothetical protein
LATTFTAEVTTRVRGRLTSALDLGSPEYNINFTASQSWTNGTGAQQANNAYTDVRTIIGGANEDLDLSGVLSNAFGTSLLATRVKEIIIYSLTTSVGTLAVTRPATNGVPIFKAAGDGIDLVAGGLFHYRNPLATSIAVTPSTGDLINFAATGGNVTYQIVIIMTT